MKKRAFESLSRDFSSFKNVVVSLTNLCQGQLKKVEKTRKYPENNATGKENTPKQYPPDVTPLAPIVRTASSANADIKCKGFKPNTDHDRTGCQGF